MHLLSNVVLQQKSARPLGVESRFPNTCGRAFIVRIAASEMATIDGSANLRIYDWRAFNKP